MTQEVFRYSIEGDVAGAEKTVSSLQQMERQAIGSTSRIEEGVRGIGERFEELDAKAKRTISGGAALALKTYASGVDRALHGTREFATEASNMGQAIELMYEGPKRGLKDFIAASRIAMRDIREDGGNAAVGVQALSVAAADVMRNFERLRPAAGVVERVGHFAGKLTGLFGGAAKSTGDLNENIERLMMATADMANSLNVQGTAWKLRTAEAQRAHEAEIKATQAAIKRAQASLKDSEKETEDYKKKQMAIRALQQELAKLTKQSGLYQVQSLQVNKVTQAVNALARQVGNLGATYQGTGKWSDRYYQRAQQQAKNVENEMRRIEKMGGKVPIELQRQYETLVSYMDNSAREAGRLKREAEKAGKAAEEAGRRGSKGMSALSKETTKTADSMSRYSQTSREVLESNTRLVQMIRPEGAMSSGMAQIAHTAGDGARGVQSFSMSMGSMIGVAGAVGGVLGKLDPAFSAVIVGVAKMADQFGQSFTAMMSVAGTGAEKIKAAMNVMSNSLLAFGTMALGTVVKTGMLGAEVTTLEVTMRQVAKNMGEMAGFDPKRVVGFQGHVEELRDSIVETGITTREATKAITQFMRAKLPLDKVEGLAKAAQNLGVTVANMSSSEVYGRFIQFIQTGNSNLLDAIGIAKNASIMHKEYADSIGKTVKALSTREKQEALIQGLMNETIAVSGVYEEAQATVSKQLSSMKRLFEEAMLVLGRKFEPMLAKVVFGMNKLLMSFAMLKPEIHDNIARVIKWVAVWGTALGVIMAAAPALKALIPIIKAIGRTTMRSMPWLLAISVAVGLIAGVVKGFKKLWDANFGGIQDSVGEIVTAIKEGLGPIIQDVTYWLNIFGKQFSTIVVLVVDKIKILVAMVSGLASGIGSKLAPVFQTIRDFVNGIMRAVSRLMLAIQAVLRADFGAAGKHVEGAVVDILTSVALLFKNIISKAAVWGWNLIVQVANGITKAATSILAKVMQSIGNMIGRFLRPGSPPKEGPLKHIVKWGQGVMTTFLRSFELADFGMLKQMMAPIKDAFQDAVKAGTMGEAAMQKRLKGMRTSVAQLLSQTRKTGKVSQEAMQAISDQLGEGGKDITEYIRRLTEHQRALKMLEDAKAAYAAEEAAGFIRAETKERLAAAEEEVKQAEEAVNWQKEFIDAQRESIDMEMQMLDALKDVADTVGDIGGDIKDGIAEAFEEPFELQFDMPEDGAMDLSGDWLGDTVEGLGAVSEEWVAMREQVSGFIQNIKDFIALPLSEKLQTIKDFLTDIVDKIIEYMEDVTGWDISGWVDDLKTSLETAWQWIVDKAQWLYDQLVGRSIIPDLVDTIIFWWEKLTAPFKAVWEGIVGVIEWVKSIAKEVMDFIKALGIVAFIAKIGTVVSLISSALGTVIGFIAGAISTIGGLIGGVVGIINALAASLAAPAAAIAAVLYGIWENKDQILGFFEDFKDEVSDIWTRLQPALKKIWEFAEPILKGLGILIGSLVGGAVLGLISIVQSLWDTVKTLLPYIRDLFHGVFNMIYGLIKGIVLPIINIFVSLLNLLTGNTEEARESLLAAFRGIKEGAILFFTGLWETVKSIFAGILQGLITFAANFLDHFANWIADVLEKFGLLDIANKLRTMFTDAETKVRTALEQLKLIIAVALFNASQTVETWKNNIVQWFEDLKTGAAEKWTTFWDGVKTKAEEIAEAIATAIINWYTGISDKFEEFKTTVAEKWTTFWDGVSTKVTEIIDAVTLTLSIWREGLRTWFEDTKIALSDKWGTFWSDVEEKVTAVKDAIIITLTTWYTDLTTWFEDTKTSVLDIWNTFWDDVSTKVTDVIDPIVTLLEVTLMTAWTTMTDAITKARDEVFTPLKTTFDNIKSAVQGVIDKVITFTQKIKDAVIPDWLQGKSPPPMATWFSDIANAMAAVQDVNLNGALSQQLATAQATGAVTNTIYQNNSFPNVRDRHDAGGFLNELEQRIGTADLRRY